MRFRPFLFSGMALLCASLAHAAPSPRAVPSRSNRQSGAAVIIGVESYRSGIPAAKHAANDARRMSEFAEKTLGFSKSRIRTLVDQEATRSDIEDALKWLGTVATDPEGSVFVFFSGHGTPATEGFSPMLVPADAPANNLESRALPVSKLLEAIRALPGKEKFLLLDACFSGIGERSALSAGARPLMLTNGPPPEDSAPDNLVFMSASEATGMSGPATSAPHGLFSYWVMNGLRGAADVGADNVVTVSELANYVRFNVEKESKEQGREAQRPTVRVGNLGTLAVVVDPQVQAEVPEPEPGQGGEDPFAVNHLPITPVSPIGMPTHGGPGLVQNVEPRTPHQLALGVRGGLPSLVGVDVEWTVSDSFSLDLLLAPPLGLLSSPGGELQARLFVAGDVEQGLFLGAGGIAQFTSLPGGSSQQLWMGAVGLGYRQVFPSGFTLALSGGAAGGQQSTTLAGASSGSSAPGEWVWIPTASVGLGWSILSR